ncbi:hypothetical protein C2E31_23265 [Rhodopirellula baltica]|nr:hypothetical protein C2E31_23265 [Rhodopirellula baltica]
MSPSNRLPDETPHDGGDHDDQFADLDATELEHWISEADRAGFLNDDDSLTSPQPNLISAGTILDRYEIVSVIGIGGRGVVYRAQQLNVASRLVALKVYHASDTESENGHSPAEILALASVSHPQLAQILDAGKTPDGRTYVVMSLLSGVAIDEFCHKRALSVSKIATLMSKASDAIDELHRHGFVHCDIKPSNILVNQEGGITVTDFDAARPIGIANPSRRGTPGYSAPEWIAPFDLAKPPSQIDDVQGDIYSLGATLYQLLTGSAPFVGHSTSGKIVSSLIDSPKPPRQLRPDIPVWLDEICLRCLDRNPRQRYSSAKQLAAALVATHGAITSKTIPSWTHFTSTRLMSLSLILGLIALFVLAVQTASERWRNHAMSDVQGEKFTFESLNLESSFALAVSTCGDATPCFLETVNPRPGFMYTRLSPDGHSLAVLGNDHWIRIYEYDSERVGSEIGDLVSMLPMDRVTDSLDRSISWSPDGTRLVCCGNDHCAMLWDVRKGQLVSRLKFDGKYNFVRDVQWSPDGSMIASGSDSGLVLLWNDRGAIERRFHRHESPVLKIQWSPDGKQIASADQSGQVLVWNVQTLERLTLFRGLESRVPAAGLSRGDAAVRGLSWHPAGRRLAFSNEQGEVFSGDCMTGKSDLIMQSEHPSRALLWSRDGRFLVIAGVALSTYSDASGVSQFDEPDGAGTLGSIQWDPNSEKLLVAGRQQELQSWDIAAGRSRVLAQPSVSRVLDLEWTTDGTWLVSGGSDGHLRLFDATGQFKAAAPLPASENSVLSIAWHPKGKLVACAYGYRQGGIAIYEVAQPILTPRDATAVTVRQIEDLRFRSFPQAIAWDTDGKFLVAGDDRGRLTVIAANNWEEVTEISPFDHAVTDLAFGKTDLVAAGDAKGRLRTWRFDSQGGLHLVGQRDFYSGINALAFNSSGQQLAVSEFRKSVFLLDAVNLAERWPRPSDAPARPGKLDWSPDDRSIACGVYGTLDARDGSLIDPDACNRGGCVAWHPTGLIATGSWEGELEFRHPPDFLRTGRFLQLSGGASIALPPTRLFKDLRETQRSELVWIARPGANRYRLLP